MPDQEKTDFFALETAIMDYEAKEEDDGTFLKATERAAATLTEEEKELLRKDWNNRMGAFHADQLKLRKRVHNRHARRSLNARR